MPHTIYGDAFALQRYALHNLQNLVLVPPVFECEECQYVREAIVRWQERADHERHDSENEGQVHVVGIGWLPPTR